MGIFECVCVALIALTLLSMMRSRPALPLLRDYLLLAVAAWLGEQSCIVLYGFYHYAPGWHVRVGHVPILVPLIWPLVVLSACDVARALWPRLSAPALALLAATLVGLDASLVEVVAVRAGLWAWAEPGHLGVPVIGILGWAYFAVGAAWVLMRLPGAWRVALLAVGPLCAHVLIQVTWWGLFRWTVRGDLGMRSLAAVVVLGVASLGTVVMLRLRGRTMPLAIAGPRALAALLFVILLLATDPTSVPLWMHATAIGLPYCVATRWRAAVPTE